MSAEPVAAPLHLVIDAPATVPASTPDDARIGYRARVVDVTPEQTRAIARVRDAQQSVIEAERTLNELRDRRDAIVREHFTELRDLGWREAARAIGQDEHGELNLSDSSLRTITRDLIAKSRTR